MSPPAALLLCEFCFVCIRPILTNLFSVEHFCPLNIRVNRALTTLDLRFNDIGVPDGWSIERSKYGDFEHYKHTDGRTQKELPQGTSSGVVALAESLKVNRALNSVDLSYNDIPDEGKQQLRNAVKGKKITLEL